MAIPPKAEKYDYSAQIRSAGRFNYEVFGADEGDQYALVEANSHFRIRGSNSSWLNENPVTVKMDSKYLSEKAKAKKRAGKSIRGLFSKFVGIVGVSALLALLMSNIPFATISLLVGTALLSIMQSSKFSDILIFAKFEKAFLKADLAMDQNMFLYVPLPQQQYYLEPEGLVRRMPGLKLKDKNNRLWLSKGVENNIVEFMKSSGKFEELLKLSHEYNLLVNWKINTKNNVNVNNDKTLNKNILEDLEKTVDKANLRIKEIQKIYAGWANDFYDSQTDSKNIALMALISEANTEFGFDENDVEADCETVEVESKAGRDKKQYDEMNWHIA